VSTPERPRGILSGPVDGAWRSPNSGLERLFRLLPGAFLAGSEQVTLVRPAPRPSPAGPGVGGPGVGGARRTASGSVAVPRVPARVARASRILVEGVHDAELVERVWGDDLRVEGIVVERLDGVDVLGEVIAAFRPGPDARLGVLVDHLVPGSKEQRLATGLQGPWVRIAGTPFVDVWQAIRPAVVGLAAWPEIPRGRPWKEGICQALGVEPPGRLWRQLLGSVRTYADLEPSLVGAVESLIDFVTVDARG